MKFKFYSSNTQSFLDCDISEETETLLKNLITPDTIRIFKKPVNAYLRLNEFEETLFELLEYRKRDNGYTFYVREKTLKSQDEILKTLKNIDIDIGYAGHNLQRIMVQYYNVKFLDPAKIEAVTIHLNRALIRLREFI